MPPRIRNDFFKSWTDDMAYCLGLWWADGCMYQQSRGGCIVIFSSKDREHLQQVRGAIGTGAIYTMKRPDRVSYQLTLGCKDAFEDILALGGTPNKTETAIWPTVPHAFLPHYARGFIDGDGSLFWQVNRKVSAVPRISACGTRAFLIGMCQAVEAATGIPSPTVIQHGPILCQVHWVGLATKCLAVWLYEDSRLHLQRKKLLAKEFAEWWPRVYHRSHTTAPMRAKFRSYLPR